MITSIDDTDGLRVTLANQLIIHLRPSGNALELRCYAEADNYYQAHDCVVKSLNNIKQI